MSSCRYCNKIITWVKDGRKNVPLESDGAIHQCDNYLKAKNSYRKIDPNDLDPDVLALYQKNMDNALKTKKK